MDLVPWNTFRDPYRLRSALDRFFTDPFYTLGQFLGSPAMRLPVEVVESGDDLVVRAELAGVEPRDLEVRVTDDGVIIRGERRMEVNQNREGIHLMERHYGSFMRSVAFPAPVDSSQARATFRNGVLEVRAPRRQTNDGRDGRRLNIEVV